MSHQALRAAACVHYVGELALVERNVGANGMEAEVLDPVAVEGISRNGNGVAAPLQFDSDCNVGIDVTERAEGGQQDSRHRSAF